MTERAVENVELFGWKEYFMYTYGRTYNNMY